MKNTYIKLSFILFVMLVLTACSNSNADKISVEEEFTEYRNTIIEPLNEKSLKIAEMFGHFATIIEETEEAYNYLSEEVIPFAKETRDVVVDARNRLVNDEIIELNEINIKHYDLTIESFTMTAEMMKLSIPPFSDKEYEKAEEIFNDNLELQEEIDRTSSKIDTKINELTGE